jgi:cysteine desulfurase
MNKRIYFDNNSTTQVDPNVLEVMIPYFVEKYGNPSSIHRIGQEIRKDIEEAREKVSEILGIKPGELTFTGSGTESDNMAIIGAARGNKEKGKHIITSNIEHAAVTAACKALEKEGFDVTYLPVREDGIINIDDFKNALREDTILVTIMHANNEIGTIQPIEEIGEITKEKKILFHVDAVQSVGKLRFKPKEWNIDMLSFSGHKFHGPKGIGGLYIRNGIKMDKLIVGGHQERNRRPGTENIPAIIGMTKALEIANAHIEEAAEREKALRDDLEKKLVERIPEVIVNGDKEKRLPGTLSLTIKYVEGESILLNLDLKGVAVSSGSACTSGSLEPSHVVLAIGVPMEHAHGTIRFSLGKYNTQEEVDYVADILPEIVEKIRSMSPFWNK